MKAAVYRRYGPSDVLQVEDIEKPIPKDHEVLIKVRAASVNPLDWRLMKGKPYTLRLIFGITKPRNTRPGVDVAGHVEAAGRNVTQFKPGDAVFGLCKAGAFAEYVCAAESTVGLKSDNVTFGQAASAPVAAFTALQGLRDKGHIQSGQKVLINGAAGGCGTYAVQIAKWFGAEVTGVCSTRNLEMVRSIGADHVIDYTREDFTKRGRRYDVLFDCIANHSLSASMRVLNPNGIHVFVGAPHTSWLIPLLATPVKALLLSPFVSQKMTTFLAKPIKEDLTLVGELMATGKITPVIDRLYSLKEVPEAMRYLEEGHARGKVIITLENRRTECFENGR